MPGQPLATAYVRVRPTVDKRAFQAEAEKGARGVKLNRAGQEAGKSFFSGFGKVAALGAAGLGVAGLGLLKGFVSDAEDAAKVNQQLANTIKTTGDASKTTVGHLQDYANALMTATGINDETIKSGQGMLLTFTNIRNEAGKNNDVFDQATKATLDMTAAMTGGNVTQENMRKTSILVGKALNDPVKGLTALRRVGVTFTDQQQEQIKQMVKSGDTMGAQKLILHELGKEFGDSAKAMTTPSQKLKTALGEIGENIGTALLPLIGQLAGFITKSVLPKMNEFSDWFTKTAVPKLTDFARKVIPIVVNGFKFIGAVFKFVSQNTEWIIPLAGALAGFAGGIMLVVKAIRIWREVQILLNIALTANPIGLVIAAIAALAAGLYLAWTRSATFRKIVIAAWTAIKDAAVAVAKWFTNSFVPFFTKTIPDAAKTAWTAVWNNFFGPLIRFFTQTIPQAITGFIKWVRIQFDTFELIVVTMLSGMIHALAVAFGWIPFGLGNKLKAADKAAQQWVQSIQNRLNSLKSPTVTVTLQVAGHGAVTTKVVGGAVQLPAGRLVFGGAAKGMRITAGTTGTADDVLVRASRGETIVSAAHSRMLAPVFSAAGVPGYAAGGFIGKIPGAMSWAAGRGTAYAGAAGAKFAQLMFAA